MIQDLIKSDGLDEILNTGYLHQVDGVDMSEFHVDNHELIPRNLRCYSFIHKFYIILNKNCFCKSMILMYTTSSALICIKKCI
jgi:hypothetical protein